MIIQNRALSLARYLGLYTGQYGFRKKHSTQHAILDTINSIQGNMDRRLYPCRIFIDLKKAFDTVDHRILLDFYGFRGVLHNWFLSYLTDRKQTTEVGGHISSSETITCGVPQGSVLGPLLQNSSRKFRFYLFADDTNILYVDKDLRSLEKVVNEEFKNVYNWLAVNKLTINISSPKKITYQPKFQIYNNEANKLECLEHKEYVKYLGILIDKNLSWRNQIDSLILKISKTVGMIAKLRHFVPRNILLHIYQSLTHPYISYGLTAWGMASKSALNRILILQKRCLRFIFFSERRAHAIPLFIDTNVLPVHFLYYEAVCCLMHDVSNQIAPSNILDLFTKTSHVHSYNTRSSTSQNYYQKFSRL